MAISTVIAGAYTSVWNSLAQGYTRRGFTLHFQTHGELINESDIYAKSLIDQLHLGADVSIEYVARIYGANVIAAAWPWLGGAGVTDLGKVSNYANPIGQLGTTAAKPFVLTSTANTPAAAAPATATASLAILAPENDMALIFSSTARDVPIRLNCLPTESGSGSTVSVSKLALTSLGWFMAAAASWLSVIAGAAGLAC